MSSAAQDTSDVRRSQSWTDRSVPGSPLEGRVTIVTGSSRGIGAAIASRMARAGSAVVVNSSSSPEAGSEVAAGLPNAVYVRADVGDRDEVAGLIARAKNEFGRIDAVVNCAGWSRVVAFEDLDGADDLLWDRCLQTHVLGVWNVTTAAAGDLRKSDVASVTNITSVAASTVTGSSIPYSVSKAGTDHLTRLLSKTLAPAIRVNGVAPGFIRTPLTASMPAEYIEAYERTIPVGHGGEPGDIADACLFVATCRFMTGTILAADGGVRIR